MQQKNRKPKNYKIDAGPETRHTAWFSPVARRLGCVARVGLMAGFGLAAAATAAGDGATYRVAAMRVQPVRWDKQHNFQLLDRYARKAAAHGAQLVVTCEGFLEPSYARVLPRNR